MNKKIVNYKQVNCGGVRFSNLGQELCEEISTTQAESTLYRGKKENENENFI